MLDLAVVRTRHQVTWWPLVELFVVSKMEKGDLSESFRYITPTITYNNSDLFCTPCDCTITSIPRCRSFKRAWNRKKYRTQQVSGQRFWALPAILLKQPCQVAMSQWTPVIRRMNQATSCRLRQPWAAAAVAWTTMSQDVGINTFEPYQKCWHFAVLVVEMCFFICCFLCLHSKKLQQLSWSCGCSRPEPNLSERSNKFGLLFTIPDSCFILHHI